MNDVAALVQVAILIGAIMLAIELIASAGGRGMRLADIFSPPADLPRPRGIQEEDCPRWDVSRLQRRATEPASTGRTMPAGTRPAEVCRCTA